jgi:hypothetical protein
MTEFKGFYSKIGVLGAIHSIRDRETDEVIYNSTPDDCLVKAAEYIQENPEAMICLYKLENRIWKCKTTGNIRSDYCDEINK